MASRTVTQTRLRATGGVQSTKGASERGKRRLLHRPRQQSGTFGASNTENSAELRILGQKLSNTGLTPNHRAWSFDSPSMVLLIPSHSLGFGMALVWLWCGFRLAISWLCV